MLVLDETWSHEGGATHSTSVQGIPPTQSALKCPKVRFTPNTPNHPTDRCLVFPSCEQGSAYTSAPAKLTCYLLPPLSYPQSLPDTEGSSLFTLLPLQPKRGPMDLSGRCVACSPPQECLVAEICCGLVKKSPSQGPPGLPAA